MSLGIIVCEDASWRGELVDVVTTHRRSMPVDVQDYETPLAAVAALGSSPPPVDFVVFSLVGGGDASQGLAHLKGACRDARVIIEFAEDYDNPTEAIELLREGAFVVVSQSMLRRAELWGTITHAISNNTPHDTVLHVKRPGKGKLKNWGFMSMTFNPGDQNRLDYQFAIEPVMGLLRLELHRVDRISFTSAVLLERVQQAIRGHDVIVAQISATTDNTMYEVGYADSLNKQPIVLWRRGSQPVPALIENFVRVEYATMTELAMKLFFGLGGTRSDL